MDGTLGSFEQQVARIETLVTRRFAALRTEVEAYRDRVDNLEGASLSALNERAREVTAETTAIGEQLASLIAATRTQLDTAIGQIVQAVGGVLLAYGVFTPQHWAAIAAAAPIIGAAAWRIYAATVHHKQIVVVAQAAPDSVAKVVP